MIHYTLIDHYLHMAHRFHPKHSDPKQLDCP